MFALINLREWGEENVQAIIKCKKGGEWLHILGGFYIISVERIVTMVTATSKMMHLAIMYCSELLKMIED